MKALLMFAEMAVSRRPSGLATFSEEETEDREGLERVIIVTDTGFLVAQVLPPLSRTSPQSSPQR
jgi:hypothetical protein